MAARIPTVALVSFLLVLTFASSAGADPLHVPLTRRSRSHPIQDLNEQANRLLLKYGLPTRPVKNNTSGLRVGRRASSSSVAVTNHNADNSYFASINIGSPPQTLNVILDTGSSDLWVAGTACNVQVGCDPSTLLFQSSKSTSFQGGTGTANDGLGNPIKVNYGSGSVTGSTSEDTVTMGGFTINNQVFLNVNRITGNITDSDVSGLMGLAFIGLAETNALPFWQALVQNNQLSSPEMAFHLARSSNPNQVDVSGGTFTLGGTNPSLFTGDIEYLNVSTSPENALTFWTLPVMDVTSNGKSVQFPSIPGNGALDTGTTLISGSTENVQAFWAAIPGSGPVRDSQLPGFFNFPCTTKLGVAISFGGKSWPINEEDMNLGQDPDDPSNCVGAIFDGGLPSDGSLSWIVGDTFLKNVYSVFRAQPPSVGLAQLSSQAGGSGPASGTKNGGVKSGDVPIITLSISMLAALARFYL